MLKLKWKPINGYEDSYAISNYGDIKSLNRTIVRKDDKVIELKERILNPVVKDGYYRIVLYKDNVLKRFYLHVLVAKHFIPNPENKKEVNHDDGNKLNCREDNLEWNTRPENIKHMWDTGLRKR